MAFMTVSPVADQRSLGTAPVVVSASVPSEDSARFSRFLTSVVGDSPTALGSVGVTAPRNGAATLAPGDQILRSLNGVSSTWNASGTSTDGSGDLDSAIAQVTGELDQVANLPWVQQTPGAAGLITAAKALLNAFAQLPATSSGGSQVGGTTDATDAGGTTGVTNTTSTSGATATSGTSGSSSSTSVSGSGDLGAAIAQVTSELDQLAKLPEVQQTPGASAIVAAVKALLTALSGVLTPSGGSLNSAVTHITGELDQIAQSPEVQQTPGAAAILAAVKSLLTALTQLPGAGNGSTSTTSGTTGTSGTTSANGATGTTGTDSTTGTTGTNGATGTDSTTGTTGTGGSNSAITQVLSELDQLAKSPEVQQTPGAAAIIAAVKSLLTALTQLPATGSNLGTAVTHLTGELDQIGKDSTVQQTPGASALVAAAQALLQALAQLQPASTGTA